MTNFEIETRIAIVGLAIIIVAAFWTSAKIDDNLQQQIDSIQTQIAATPTL